MNLKKKLNFYGCTVEYINSNAKAIYIYIRLGIWRCDGPGRHRMLTVIIAYYGYYGILLIHLYSFNIRRKVQDSTFSNWYSTDPDAIVSLHVKVTKGAGWLPKVLSC